MAGYRIAGPTCSTRNSHAPPIDPGTNPRTAMPVSGPVSSDSQIDSQNEGLSEAMRDLFWVQIQQGLQKYDAFRIARKIALQRVPVPGFCLTGRDPDLGLFGPLGPIVIAIEELYEEYSKLCDDEFSRIASNRPNLLGQINYDAKDHHKEPKEYYRHMREAYYRPRTTKKGNPAQSIYNKMACEEFVDAILDINQVAKFLGRGPVPVHPRMAEAMAEAEADLRKTFSPQVVAEMAGRLHTMDGFEFRANANDPTAISEHAFGFAIDVGAHNNPNLFGTKAQAIDDLLQSLGVRDKFHVSDLNDQKKLPKKDAGAVVEERFKNMKQISDRVQKFLNDWLDEWNNDLIQGRVPMKDGSPKAYNYRLLENFLLAFGAIRKTKKHSIEIVQQGMKTIGDFKANGLMTIPLAVYQALKKFTANSGLEYKGGKDVMHFEVPWPSP